LKIKKALPLNEPVIVEFTPPTTGDITFACVMNMLHGTVPIKSSLNSEAVVGGCMLARTKVQSW